MKPQSQKISQRRRPKFFNGLLLISFFAASVMIASAQTNATTNPVDSLLALANTNPPPPLTNGPIMPETRGPTTITAAGPVDLDLNDHWTIYRNDVCVSNAEVKLTCKWARAIFPQNWDRPTNILAETNVVIDYFAQDGQKTRAMGDEVVDIYQVINGVTNDIVTMTGNTNHWPRIERADGYVTGEKFVWDRVAGNFHVEGPFEMKGSPIVAPATGSKSSRIGTNSLAMIPAGTNAPPMPQTTNSP